MDTVTPGGATGESSSGPECQSCTHRDFLDRGDVDLAGKSDRRTASGSPFQKAGGFFHSRFQTEGPGCRLLTSLFRI